MQIETRVHPEALFIRSATLADIDDILATQHSAPEAAQWPRDAYTEALTHCAHQTQGLQRIVLCALQNHRVVGFAVGSRLAIGETTECELENMAVHPDHRRCGWGGKLAKAILAWCGEQSATQVRLEVRASNVAAIELYENLRFKIAGRRKHYYAHPAEDAVLMVWTPAESLSPEV